jgi:hypothetical protein
MGFLAAAAPFLAAGASVLKGVGGLMAGQANKEAAFEQAREERLAALEQERQTRIDARGAIGQQLAAQWGNGLEGGTGSALDALRESQINAALDVLTIRRDGAGKSRSLEAEGRNAAREGYFSLASGLLGAASQFGSMNADWAQAKRGSSAPSRPSPGGGPVIDTRSGRGG